MPLLAYHGSLLRSSGVLWLLLLLLPEMGPVTSVMQVAREKVGIDGRQLGPSDLPQVGGYGFVATPQIYPGTV